MSVSRRRCEVQASVEDDAETVLELVTHTRRVDRRAHLLVVDGVTERAHTARRVDHQDGVFDEELPLVGFHLERQLRQRRVNVVIKQEATRINDKRVLARERGIHPLLVKRETRLLPADFGALVVVEHLPVAVDRSVAKVIPASDDEPVIDVVVLGHRFDLRQRVRVERAQDAFVNREGVGCVADATRKAAVIIHAGFARVQEVDELDVQ